MVDSRPRRACHAQCVAVFPRRPAIEPHPVAQMPAPREAAFAECGFPAKVYFEVDQAVIETRRHEGYRGARGLHKKEKGLKVDITGYTDKTGDPDKNLELAKNRAKAVQDNLVTEGVAMKNITLKAPMFSTFTGTTGTGSDAEDAAGGDQQVGPREITSGGNRQPPGA